MITLNVAFITLVFMVTQNLVWKLIVQWNNWTILIIFLSLSITEPFLIWLILFPFMWGSLNILSPSLAIIKTWINLHKNDSIIPSLVKMFSNPHSWSLDNFSYFEAFPLKNKASLDIFAKLKKKMIQFSENCKKISLWRRIQIKTK